MLSEHCECNKCYFKMDKMVNFMLCECDYCFLKRSGRSPVALWPHVRLVKEGRAELSMEGHAGQRSMGAPEQPSWALRLWMPGLSAPPPVPALHWGAEAPLSPLSPLQRTCLIQRKCSPRTSPSGTPTTSWTKSKALSQRTHRVTSPEAAGPRGVGVAGGPKPLLSNPAPAQC